MLISPASHMHRSLADWSAILFRTPTYPAQTSGVKSFYGFWVTRVFGSNCWRVAASLLWRERRDTRIEMIG